MPETAALKKPVALVLAPGKREMIPVLTSAQASARLTDAVQEASKAVGEANRSLGGVIRAVSACLLAGMTRMQIARVYNRARGRSKDPYLGQIARVIPLARMAEHPPTRPVQVGGAKFHNPVEALDHGASLYETYEAFRAALRGAESGRALPTTLEEAATLTVGRLALTVRRGNKTIRYRISEHRGAYAATVAVLRRIRPNGNGRPAGKKV